MGISLGGTGSFESDKKWIHRVVILREVSPYSSYSKERCLTRKIDCHVESMFTRKESKDSSITELQLTMLLSSG